MIWRRWREARAEPVPEPSQEPFADLLEEAPVMALLVDADNRVVAANQAAREYFGIVAGRLPMHMAEVTREARLDELLRQGKPEGEARLTHSQRVVTSKLVPGPDTGLTLVFLTDVTELRRLQTVRQEFVANLSHELKTPLTALRLAAESLEGHPSAQVRQRFLERILTETDRVSAIVDNLRQLAEIEAGRALVERTPVDIDAVLHEVAQQAGGRPVELAVGGGLLVQADRAKLAQALGNLLDNAAKFSPPGSTIEVSAEAVDSEVQIRVRDHGPGISPEHWDRVFERFYKVDPARNREMPGTGLGLAIVKHLVLLQGGRVWTQAAEGGGQVFGVALPRPVNEPIRSA